MYSTHSLGKFLQDQITMSPEDLQVSKSNLVKASLCDSFDQSREGLQRESSDGGAELRVHDDDAESVSVATPAGEGGKSVH